LKTTRSKCTAVGDDGKAITCRITLEEMMREYMRGTTPASFEDHFQMLRPEIEERARKQILAKGMSSDGAGRPDRQE
jgi:hypothetical protein